jgi:predicted ATPase/class 3 adenylate cyclase/predicted negative regulator of RcsB-dependent stress response
MIPSGAVTLLFTDIEGSTSSWEDHPTEMEAALARHDELVRRAVEAAGGYVFKTVGDAFCAAFADATDGLRAAVDAQRLIDAELWPEVTPIRVRMGLHSGVCVERDGDYFGQTVNRVARLEATAHGGQVVVSGATAELVRGCLPAAVTLRDLGEHRLKDLGRPVLVFQVCVDGLASDFPPLRSLSNPELETNLPEQVSSFVGRDRELGEIRELLKTARLVTLTGPGGAGKTRLALQVAVDLVDGSGDGVWLVELAALADPELVAAKVASVLGVREDAGLPMLDTLVDAMRDRKTLVVLDNCEHVIDATAKLADALLRSCPGVQLLATSREPLGVSGEHVFGVPSLGVPDADANDLDELLGSEAVWLFVERAGQHNAGFTLDRTNAAAIARVCRRLDGIPLAIELAAARVRSLSLAELEARLDQRFRLLTGGVRTALPRQQTLQALIDWSWDLLNQAERIVLARLGVFAGGWDLDAAEAVASGDDTVDVADWEVVDYLRALVDKSLVQTDDTTGTVRYRLLESVREYANAKLAERGEGEAVRVRTAHRGHYVAFAEAAAPHLIAHEQDEWLDRLEVEHDNLRAALAQSLADPDPEPGMRLGTALWWFYRVRGHAVEGIETLTALLDRPDAQSATPTRGRALAILADLLTEVGNYPDAVARSDEALVIGRAEGDDSMTAQALSTLSWARHRRGDLIGALAFADTGLAAARAVGDADFTASLLNRRGAALAEQGDGVGARACYHEALDLYRQTGNRIRANHVMVNLAIGELAAGELDAARANLTEALTTLHARRDPSVRTFAAFNLGVVELLDDDHPAAQHLFIETLTTARSIGDRSTVAYALLGLALATTRRQPERAASIHGAADSLFDQLGIVLEHLEAGLRDADHAHLRSTLGDHDFDAAYQSGRTLDREDAIALALPSEDPHESR